MAETTPITPPYRFRRSERAIYAEIFFPKKVVYMSEIYIALEASLKEREVKRYLTRRENTASLLVKLQDYPSLFDPQHYRRTYPRTSPVTLAEALQRIAQYRSVIVGWSIYEVDGVYMNPRRGEPDDELTQVVRLIFRPEKHIATDIRRLVANQNMHDVLQAMVVSLDRHCVHASLPTSQERYLWPSLLLGFQGSRQTGCCG